MSEAIREFRTNRRSQRLAVLIAAALAAVIVVVGSIGAGSSDGYKIRVEFKNASAITTGSDVRVGGANVGSVKSIFVSDGNLASIVVNITDPAFQRFHSDATCRVRLQSLIGEKFLDCNPGHTDKPELRVDPTDSSRRVMDVKHTRSPVDMDELLDAMREPQRQRFRVIMNELGITLTGRGQDLQDIIDNFDGTFLQLNKVLKLLAKQNQDLVTMAEQGDASLKELAANREHITGLFKEADTVSRAVNNKRTELAETLQRIPAFFDELEPTARELKGFVTEAAPVAKSARKSAKNLSTFVSGTDKFMAELNPALKRFGESIDVYREQIPLMMPIAEDLNRFAGNRDSVANFNKLLSSFEDQGGYANLASMAFGITGALNGFDSFGHFMRTSLVINSTCPFYAQQSITTCVANFTKNRDDSNLPPAADNARTSASASGAKAGTSSTQNAALDYLLGGER